MSNVRLQAVERRAEWNRDKAVCQNGRLESHCGK